MSRPADHESRKRIIDERERNVVVEASAGTGKTTLMIERIAALLEAGNSIRRLVAVTFTKAAAAELRARTRQKLVQAGLTGQLRELPLAHISTIHGFARHILRYYSHLTGVDPLFEYGPERHREPDIARLWDEYLSGLDGELLRQCAPLLERAGSQGLLELALGMEQRHWIDDPGVFGSLSSLQERLKSELHDQLDLMGEEDGCRDKSDKLYEALVSCRELVNLSLYTAADLDIDRIGTALKAARPGNQGKKDNWGGEEGKRRVKEALKDITTVIGEALPSLAGAGYVVPLWELLEPFVTMLRKRVSDDPSYVPFDEQLLLATKAIAESEEIREDLRRRFDHVLVDEFQDTSRLQAELFGNFLRTLDGTFEKGSITVVGDPKQSIYGWRNADIEVYSKTIDALRESGALDQSISVNFRSTETIVAFVNAFGQALFEAQDPEEVPFGCTYSPIQPRENAPPGEPVRLLRFPRKLADGTRPRVPDCAARAASWFARLIEEGCAKGDQPGDYALLVRKGTHVPIFVGALRQAGIKVSVATRSNFKKRTEVSDLRELLRCLSAPSDLQAWIHTLRSLAFGVDDASITRAKARGCTGYLEPSDKTPPKVSRANAMLRTLREAAVRLPLPDLLLRIYYRTDLMAAISGARYEVDRRLSSLQSVLEWAVEGRAVTCGGMAELLEKEQPVTEGLEDPARPRPDMRAVTLATIYRSKGLGYKHVVLAEISGKRGGGRSDILTTYDHGRIAAFSMGSRRNYLRGPNYPEIERIENARNRAEKRRLFYVGATRAMESLTLIYSDDTMMAEAAEQAVRRLKGDVLQRELEPEEERPPTFDRPVLSPPERIDDPPAGPLFPISITFEEPTPEEELGLRTHAILEVIDFDRPREWIEENADPDDEAARLALAFFEMDLPFDLQACTVLGREYPLVVKGQTGTEEGYIDLLLDDGEKLIVVDYKTDRIPPEGMSSLVSHHRSQQLGYVEAVQKAFDRPALSYLAFLRPPAGTFLK
ncbi:AAA family ATPase [Candidatus Fermentibacteria bacterium]|nr:AAA family ATPase [Candidatus Fermentibacteria bacterium]